MPRIARVIGDGCYYHIITRGNDKKRIFKLNRDYLYFLSLVEIYLSKHPVCLHHYCLMNNHVHFLIKVIRSESVPKFFQGLLQSYAYYFRNKYSHTGYLFQNRYKSYLIDKEDYLLECARYIERNPLRAKLTTSLSGYRWSSFTYYAAGDKNNIIKIPNPLYIQLANTDIERRKAYQEYVLKERPYDLIVDKGLMIA